ncbi:MAG: carboxypeptidase-like regulatory domain-containing protein [Bacteroidales bacterium]
MISDNRGMYFKAVLLFLLYCPAGAYSQCYKGNVLSSETNSGIGYASVGIIGSNVGTVCDGDGNFTLNLYETSDSDTLRFSMIGYDPKSICIRQIRKSSSTTIFLDPKSYPLNEVKVVYYKPRKMRLGSPVKTNDLRSGFESNNLGSELGVKINVRKKVRLKDINLNVAKCTYDSVTYRLNIYQADRMGSGYKNILTRPIYISFTKDRINDVLSFDLSDYSIIIEGNILIALELYKELGEGKLLFNTQYFTGLTYHRKSSGGSWTQSPGAIGMYLNSNEIR